MMSAKDTDKKNITIKRSFLIVLLLAAVSFGAFIGRGTGMLGGIYENSDEERSADPGGEFRFIRPVRGHRPPDIARAPRELKPFRYKVDALIQSKLRIGDASTVSVFFQDLKSGHRFGIREQEPFSPESLLKLPLMVAYFKWAESYPHILKHKIPYAGSKEESGLQSTKVTRPLEKGRSYTVDDLILRMIAYDDVDAHALLMANLPPGYLDQVFKDIYANYDPAKKDDAVTFSAYASFFRVLYNASYLSNEMSEKALRYLSRSAFRDGIVAGIPPNVDCAIKSGERAMQDDAGRGIEKEMKQLHEFGIIYYPGRAYLMGIMARGEDSGKLTNVIRDVTTLIYEEIDRQSRWQG
jgi:beta-lactamase class A